MASAELSYSRVASGVDDMWKTSTELQQTRNIRRMSQPAAFQSYRRDSVTREPFQSYRRDSLARNSGKDYRNGSVARDSIPSYRRDSFTRDPLRDYRSASVTNEPYQSYRRDSISRDASISNYRRDSLKRESIERESTQQSNGTTGRRGSDADDINWIEKYKRSDHHTDRMINKKIEDQKAMADSLSDDRSSLRNRSSSFSSALHSSTNQSNHVSTSKPLHYEATNKITLFLQPAQTSTPRSSYPTSHLTLHEQPRSTSQRRSSETLFSSSGPSRPPPSSLSSSSRTTDYRSSFISDRFSPRSSSVLGSTLSGSSIFRRRNSVDSSMIKASRSSAFSPIASTASSRSDYRSSPAPSISSLSQSYRPSFTRAPSLPPSLQSRPPSTLLHPLSSTTTNGFNRSSADGSFTSRLTGRRYSLANVSDLSTPNYRRSVDLSALKSTTGSYKSSNLSAFGSDRTSHETMSSLSPLSPMSPLSPSHLPPPSERIFGSRGTHSPMRRNRRSLADG